MSQLHRFRLLVVPVLVGMLCQPAFAGHHRRRAGHGCGGCDDFQPAPCQTTYKTIERTIMVPQMVTVNRTVKEVELVAEQQQRTVTVCRHVPETHQYEYKYTVPTWEKRTREVSYTVCKPVMTTEQRQVTVAVPHTETRQGTRQVCRMVPVTLTRTVCEDKGSWQEVRQEYKVGCGDCARTCYRVCKVWAPNIQKRDVQYTVMRPKMEQVTYDYQVVVCTNETRTENVQVCHIEKEQQTRQIEYTVCVPQERSATREYTTCKRVPEEKTITCTVRVPKTVEREVPVQVCQMVPKKITCQVPVTDCGGCN